MTVNWNDFVLLAILSAAIHWLIARSKIAQPIWSRTRGWFASLLACPACSGFWIGCALTATGIKAVVLPTIASIIANGLLALFLTPIAEAVFMWGLQVSSMDTDPPVDS